MTPAPSGSDAQWPPRSPRDALLSTPKGRQRYRDYLNQTSPSPSPRKQARSAADIAQSMDLDEDEEEDEETLQLKLQEIQARLKLKTLQSAKTREQEAGSDVPAAARTTSAFSFGDQPANRSTASRANDRIAMASQERIQVPASPVRKVQAAQPQTPPSRVLLGIDKGLKAEDISLKRAPSLKRFQQGSGSGQDGGYLRRSRTPGPANQQNEVSRPLSFNERLASVRTEEASKAERQERIQKIRTKAFGIGQNEMEQLKRNAIDIPDEPLVAPDFSREEVMANSHGGFGHLPRSHTEPNLASLGQEVGAALDYAPAAAPAPCKRKPRVKPEDLPEAEAAAFEPYSAFHLSKRNIPHTLLTRHVTGKKTYKMKDLLKVVKSPDYALPDIEQDIVFFAIVAKKSEPKSHKPAPARNGRKPEERGKFMVVTLVDLDFELELYLFNSGFERYWKLTEGTVIAILNPNIMPPPPARRDTGRFSLVISSDDDSIIEIGAARDLGFCKSMKRDGQLCMAWVNQKKTHFCEFHSSEAVKKTQSSRIEMNMNGFSKGELNGFGGGNSQYKKNYRNMYLPTKKEKEKAKEAKPYDRDSQSHFFATRSYSAADLIDGYDRAPSDHKERAEALKRNLAAKEREVEMMKKLSKVGSGAGREYMQRAGSRATDDVNSSMASSQAFGSSEADYDEQEKKEVDAAKLGLLGKNQAVHLSPIKRKRPESSQTGSVAASSSLGWGNDLKSKLARMKDGEKLRGSPIESAEPPMRKKTRFVTEKGIREAGRESLGLDLSDRRVILDDDDDDELVILK